jgi:nicotinate phosphoribosyltransferase
MVMRNLSSSRALLVDLYELTMAAGYFQQGLKINATFELFLRHLPPERSYLVAAGVESALEYLADLRFSGDDIGYLRSLDAFRRVPGAFFDYLREFRFSGQVRAMPEGTLVFGEEPILQVTAPIAEAQIVETYLLSVINFETLIASKAARVVHWAKGRGVLEFGTRRAQGPEAGLRAARAAYIGGCVGTSNVAAGRLYDIPVAGTAAHSWTQAFATERESFEAFVETFPETAVLLIDTYDSLAGARIAATLGKKFAGVRIDSGDLLEKSREVRRILDEAGLSSVQIVASGDLNEFKIEELVREGAPIDSFGVGTDLATSRDLPTLPVVYKLVAIEIDGRVEAKTKFSEEKSYLPGPKQVSRFLKNGKFHHDLIAGAGEKVKGATPLLELAMENGERTAPPLSAVDLRERARAGLARLPDEFHALRDAPVYPVLKSEALTRLLEELHERYLETARAAGGRV